jgi:hypothetical protein
LGYPRRVVQVLRLHCWTNAYGYTYSDRNRYVYGNSNGYCHCCVYAYSYGSCDSNGNSCVHTYGYSYSDLYSNCYGDIHTDGDSHGNSNRYCDANAGASCPDGIERYQREYQQLYGELDHCQWCDQLSVRRFYQQHVWYFCGALQQSECWQCDYLRC